MYYQGKEFIGHGFRKYLIEEEYKITNKPRNSVNNMPNMVLEWVHQVLGNLVQPLNISTQTFTDKD